MKHNVGKPDSWFRVIVGVIVIALGFYYKNWWGAIGVIPLVTGFIHFCPLYFVFKASTAKEE